MFWNAIYCILGLNVMLNQSQKQCRNVIRKRWNMIYFTNVGPPIYIILKKHNYAFQLYYKNSFTDVIYFLLKVRTLSRRRRGYCARETSFILTWSDSRFSRFFKVLLQKNQGSFVFSTQQLPSASLHQIYSLQPSPTPATYLLSRWRFPEPLKQRKWTLIEGILLTK